MLAIESFVFFYIYLVICKQIIVFLSLQFGCLLFLFLVQLFLQGLLVLFLIVMMRMGIVTLYWILEKMLSGFLHRLWYYQWKFYYVFVEISSFCTYFVECLSWMNVYFIKCFFCTYWDYHVVFIFNFINVVYHISRFIYMLNHPCFPGINPLVMLNEPFNMLLNSVQRYWGFLHLCSTWILVCSVCGVFVWLWY